ncbi:MAG TPA: xanthine dehydrogenase family protein subunit M [Myxococcota bacterium]|nr:xanthine dehydrogenase family protein subunit M [Myxococcota bacterium]
MTPIPYHRPSSLEGALRLVQRLGGARYIAGGTDLLVQMKDHRHEPDALISLRAVPELRVLELDQGARIGAAVPVSELLESPELVGRWPALADALREIGSVQIQNSATLGGNLCNASPAADSTPILLSLGARVRLAGPGGRRTMDLDAFLVGPGRTALTEGEILVAIELDEPGPGERSVFFKKTRVAMDLAIVNLGATLRMEAGVIAEVRLAAGSVGPRAMRLREAEALLLGQGASPELIARAAAAAQAEVRPISDVRGSAEYRRAIVGVFVKRALASLVREA